MQTKRDVIIKCLSEIGIEGYTVDFESPIFSLMNKSYDVALENIVKNAGFRISYTDTIKLDKETAQEGKFIVPFEQFTHKVLKIVKVTTLQGDEAYAAISQKGELIVHLPEVLVTYYCVPDVQQLDDVTGLEEECISALVSLVLSKYFILVGNDARAEDYAVRSQNLIERTINSKKETMILRLLVIGALSYTETMSKIKENLDKEDVRDVFYTVPIIQGSEYQAALTELVASDISQRVNDVVSLSDVRKALTRFDDYLLQQM